MKSATQDEFTSSKAFAKELFPNPEKMKFSVSAEQQQTELKRIKEGLRYEQFFCIIDMLNFEMKYAAGFEALGYNSSQVSLKDYFKMIKVDGIVQLMQLLGRETFKLSHLDIINFMRPKFITTIPMIHTDGRTLLIKRTISPWQVTTEMQIVEYISEFTVIGEYNGEPINPRIEDVNPAAKEIYDRVVNKMLAVQPHFKNPFSPKETLLLKYYNENEGNSPQVTAGENNITVQTLYDYNKKILSKAKKFFGENVAFTSAKMVAKHLKDNGFLK